MAGGSEQSAEEKGDALFENLVRPQPQPFQRIGMHQALHRRPPEFHGEGRVDVGTHHARVPPLADQPDAVFVEDPAIVLDEVAIMTRMGAELRRGESESLAEAIARFRPLRWIAAPGTLEGGDVVRIGSTLFVGRSARSNDAGIAQLARELAPFGYAVQPVEMRGCLHLKSACTYLGRDTILANRGWADLTPFANVRVIDVPPGEPSAADVLAIGGTAIVPASFPETAHTLDRAGWRALALDVSELQKAEAGVTCMSLIFDA